MQPLFSSSTSASVSIVVATLATRRWVEAAVDVRDKALETGADRVGTAKRRGNQTLDRARSVKDKLSDGVFDRTRFRRRGDETEHEDL